MRQSLIALALLSCVSLTVALLPPRQVAYASPNCDTHKNWNGSYDAADPAKTALQCFVQLPVQTATANCTSAHSCSMSGSTFTSALTSAGHVTIYSGGWPIAVYAFGSGSRVFTWSAPFGSSGGSCALLPVVGFGGIGSSGAQASGLSSCRN